MEVTGFDEGTYTLFTYGGDLLDNALQIGTTPSGFLFELDLITNGQVDLIVTIPEPSVGGLLLVSGLVGRWLRGKRR